MSILDDSILQLAMQATAMGCSGRIWLQGRVPDQRVHGGFLVREVQAAAAGAHAPVDCRDCGHHRPSHKV